MFPVMHVNENSASVRFPVGFYEWLWLFIGAISAVSVLLLALGRFNAVYAVTGGLIIVILAGTGLGLRFAFKWDRRFNLVLLAILMLALLFRWGPYPHHIVGQDQGLYVNMAKVYARFGGLDFKDSLRQNLSEEQKKLYDANGGALFQSAVPTDGSKTKIRICFYPLHPAWMAIFARGLGEGNGGYSVVFFSILAIVGLYLLTEEISNSRRAAYLAALFAALNPGLAFFAKFPVSELVVLAFTTNGFYFLCRGYRRLKENKSCWIYFVLAAGCFNAFFYTRMSAVYYIPFMALLFLCSLIDLPGRKQRIKITGFFLCLAILFGLSWLFYSRFLPHLFSDIVNQFSSRLMGSLNPHRVTILTGIGFIFCAFALFVWWWAKYPARCAKAQMFLRNLAWAAPVLIVMVLAMHPIWKIIADPHVNFAYRKFANDVPGWRMFFYSSIYRYILYLSPLGFILLIAGSFCRKIRENSLTVLAVVFLGLMLAACLFQPYSPYAFYYDRYYLSEVIPCSLMLMAIIIAPAAPVTAAGRWLRIGAAAFIAVYFAFFSFCQLGKTEGSYPDFFCEVKEIMGSNDLLLCDQYNPNLPHPGEQGFRRPINAVFTPYYNIKTFPLRSESELNRPEITELAKKYDNVYFLTYDPCHHPDFTCVKNLRYTEGFFIAGSHAWTDSAVKIIKNQYDYLLPFKHYEYSLPLYLYCLEKKPETNAQKKY
jgi:4-amino-4-deoxy-L-arabinose transferase-like glycosyltransferase